MMRFVLLLELLVLCVACGDRDFSENIPVLSKSIALPDAKFSNKDTGFTSTGLAYDEIEECFWVGNAGKMLPHEPEFRATIVKMSKTGQLLDEIMIWSTFGEMKDCQGLTVDSSNNSLWFCSFSENKVRNITKLGKSLSCININKPTGVAYDKRTDSLWVLTYSNLLNMSKQGGLLRTIPIKIAGQDQLYLDTKQSLMLVTAGLNYSGDNYVYSVDLVNGTLALAYTLVDRKSVV